MSRTYLAALLISGALISVPLFAQAATCDQPSQTLDALCVPQYDYSCEFGQVDKQGKRCGYGLPVTSTQVSGICVAEECAKETSYKNQAGQTVSGTPSTPQQASGTGVPPGNTPTQVTQAPPITLPPAQSPTTPGTPQTDTQNQNAPAPDNSILSGAVQTVQSFPWLTGQETPSSGSLSNPSGNETVFNPSPDLTSGVVNPLLGEQQPANDSSPSANQTGSDAYYAPQSSFSPTPSQAADLSEATQQPSQPDWAALDLQSRQATNDAAAANGIVVYNPSTGNTPGDSGSVGAAALISPGMTTQQNEETGALIDKLGANPDFLASYCPTCSYKDGQIVYPDAASLNAGAIQQFQNQANTIAGTDFPNLNPGIVNSLGEQPSSPLPGATPPGQGGTGSDDVASASANAASLSNNEALAFQPPGYWYDTTEASVQTGNLLPGTQNEALAFSPPGYQYDWASPSENEALAYSSAPETAALSSSPTDIGSSPSVPVVPVETGSALEQPNPTLPVETGPTLEQPNPTVPVTSTESSPAAQSSSVPTPDTSVQSGAEVTQSVQNAVNNEATQLAQESLNYPIYGPQTQSEVQAAIDNANAEAGKLAEEGTSGAVPSTLDNTISSIKDSVSSVWNNFTSGVQSIAGGTQDGLSTIFGGTPQNAEQPAPDAGATPSGAPGTAGGPIETPSETAAAPANTAGTGADLDTKTPAELQQIQDQLLQERVAEVPAPPETPAPSSPSTWWSELWGNLSSPQSPTSPETPGTEVATQPSTQPSADNLFPGATADQWAQVAQEENASQQAVVNDYVDNQLAKLPQPELLSNQDIADNFNATGQPYSPEFTDAFGTSPSTEQPTAAPQATGNTTNAVASVYGLNNGTGDSSNQPLAISTDQNPATLADHPYTIAIKDGTLGSEYMLTNPQTSQSEIVCQCDRAPFDASTYPDGRSVDMGVQVASDIGFSGVGPIQLTPVSPDTPLGPVSQDVAQNILNGPAPTTQTAFTSGGELQPAPPADQTLNTVQSEIQTANPETDNTRQQLASDQSPPAVLTQAPAPTATQTLSALANKIDSGQQITSGDVIKFIAAANATQDPNLINYAGMAKSYGAVSTAAYVNDNPSLILNPLKQYLGK